MRPYGVAMNYLERRELKRQMDELEVRLVKVAETVGLKKPIPMTRPAMSSMGRALLVVTMLTFSAAFAYSAVFMLTKAVPRGQAPGFYAGLAVVSAATLVALFRNVSELVLDYWRLDAVKSSEHAQFFLKAFFAFLPLFLAVYAAKEYLESKSEAHIYLTAITPISTGSEGLFRFNVVFGDPDLRSAEAGWGTLILKEHPSIAVQNSIHRDFLKVMGQRLRDCGRTIPVELDIVGYFSSSLWVADSKTGELISDERLARVLDDGWIDILKKDKSVERVSLDKNQNRARLQRNVIEIRQLSAAGPTGIQRARDTPEAFNLWVAEERADAVCRALLGRASDEECGDVVDGPVRIRNVSRMSTFAALESRLQTEEPKYEVLVKEANAADQRVLARSAEVIVRKAGSCEVPVSN